MLDPHLAVKPNPEMAHDVSAVDGRPTDRQRPKDGEPDRLILWVQLRALGLGRSEENNAARS